MKGRLVLALVAVVVLLNGAWPTAPGLADSPAPAGTQAGEWVAAATIAAHQTAAEQRFQTTFPANALMVHWQDDPVLSEAQAEISTSQDGRNWSSWFRLPIDEDSNGRGEDGRRYTGTLMVSPSRSIAVRLVNPLGQSLTSVPDLRVTYLNTLNGPSVGEVEAQAKKRPTRTPEPAPTPAPPTAPPAQPGNGYSVISRAGWGADEQLRFRNSKEIWPREFQAPEKVILHHTETPNDQDPLAAIRAVYYFHAVTRGWGDIGYNYLIDRDGRIYEGRFGGPNVIAGHTLGFNTGSLGIAVLGSFQTSPLPSATEESIVRLVADRARWVDPIGQSWFVNRVTANISGHRDCTNTACPGEAFYPRLSAIRDRVLQRIGVRPQLDVRISDVTISPPTLKTGERFEVRATITNTGTAVLPADRRGANGEYVEGQDYDQRGLPKVTNRFRLALDAGDGKYQYRWGLGRNLLPGESLTVVGTIQVTNPQARTFSVGLVQENVKYWARDLSPTPIQVTGPPIVINPPVAPPPPIDPTGPLPTDRVAPPAIPDPNRRYFPETGHFIGFGFRAYWEANGGLSQFGYPLTEEFTERNPADGKEYTVQYFERARFEYHPEHKGTPHEVLLGLLGNQVTNGRGFLLDPPANRPPREGARYFPATKYWVSGPILKYWNERGGLAMYGYPISPELEETNPDDGKTYLVQYFERNRLEYHPELKSTPFEVMLGQLGRQVLVERGWLTRGQVTPARSE